MRKVLVAEDHDIVLIGLQMTFEKEFKDCVLEYVNNSAALLASVKNNTYDLVIIDLVLKDGSSLPALKQILSDYPELKILVFSGNPENSYAKRLLNEGVKGFLSKQSDDPEVTEAIRTVLSGNIYMSEHVKKILFSNTEPAGSNNPLKKLSTQEMQVAILMQQGKKPSEICSQLNLQSSTVGTYKMKLFAKLGISNVIELKELFFNYAMPE